MRTFAAEYHTIYWLKYWTGVSPVGKGFLSGNSFFMEIFFNQPVQKEYSPFNDKGKRQPAYILQSSVFAYVWLFRNAARNDCKIIIPHHRINILVETFPCISVKQNFKSILALPDIARMEYYCCSNISSLSLWFCFQLYHNQFLIHADASGMIPLFTITVKLSGKKQNNSSFSLKYTCGSTS